jgi:hypothetical protein
MARPNERAETAGPSTATRFWALSPHQSPGAPHPRFPVEFRGFPELHAPFLKERRTRGPFQSCVQEIRGISLVFREMWDTAGLPLKPVSGPTAPHGCPMFASAYVGRKRWAKPLHGPSFRTLQFARAKLCRASNALTSALASSLLPSRPLALHTARSPANPSSDLELRTAK